MVKNLFRTSRRNHSITGTVKNPELVFGIVGPIGVNIDAVMDALSKSLSEVQYIVEPIHLTDLIRSRRIRKKLDFSSYYSRYQSLIAYANEFRRLAGDAAALAGVAIFRIRQLRSQATKKADVPALGKAYIIRQFKRAEEIALMRSVYGRKFIQVSVFGSAQDRRSVLINKIQHHDSSPKTDAECERQAIDLINIDHNQKDEEHGQRLSEAFHLGDVFVDGIDPAKAEKTINRFIKALFGSNSESPSKDEYGLYIAAAASLRSVDLSRQVGAAIFTSTAEIISMGCNEVPKAGGGTY
jgi:deoxycytidylate deaminase